MFEREEAILHGQYELIETVARSGNSEVIRGRHRDIDQRVAVKRISSRDAPAQVARLLRAEAEILTVLSHPHILRVYNYNTDGEIHLLVMEWLERGTLRRYFADAGRSVLDVCVAGIVTASALQAAHARNVVHRDVKPANLLVADNHTIKLADFGIAQIVDEGGPAGGASRAGTLQYAPAEQIRDGRVSPAADVYALGVTLYELFSGALPFPPPAGAGVDQWEHFAHLHETVIPPRLDTIGPTPAAFAEVVSRAMDKDPTRRHQSGLEVALDLTAAVVGTYGRDAFAQCALPLYVEQELREAMFGAEAAALGEWAAPRPDLVSAGEPHPTGTRRWRRSGPRRAPDRRTSPPSAPEFTVVPGDPVGLGTSNAGGRRRQPGAARLRPAPEPVHVLDSHGIALGADGSVYLSQPAKHQVLRIRPTGEGQRVLGTREAGHSGGSGSGRMSRIDTPYGLACGPDGMLYVADSGNNRILRVDPDRDVVEVVAGAAGSRALAGPRGVAFDHDGALLIADTDAHRILRIEAGAGGAGGRVDVVAGGAGGRVDVVAGTGAPGTSGDHGPARLARLRRPSAVTVAADGRILIADTDNDRLRAVSPDGHITTVAGAAYDPRQRRLPRPGRSPSATTGGSPSPAPVWPGCWSCVRPAGGATGKRRGRAGPGRSGRDRPGRRGRRRSRLPCPGER
ncbi:serine/threonine-protein kinase, partial [Parafrankia sp. EUN1f]|uniref:serine/threonine-protein kinase n=1 Tax=Parafrankia sp. EUN1f TaxID=102897 RepID=UPI0001C46D58